MPVPNTPLEADPETAPAQAKKAPVVHQSGANRQQRQCLQALTACLNEQTNEARTAIRAVLDMTESQADDITHGDRRAACAMLLSIDRVAKNRGVSAPMDDQMRFRLIKSSADAAISREDLPFDDSLINKACGAADAIKDPAIKCIAHGTLYNASARGGNTNSSNATTNAFAKALDTCVPPLPHHGVFDQAFQFASAQGHDHIALSLATSVGDKALKRQEPTMP